MTLGEGTYGFNDLEVGDCLETGWRDIDAALIDDFACLSRDYYEIHMDAAAARAKGFEGRVAHGLLVLSVIDGLKNTAPARFDALAFMGWDWRFKAPVLEGDRITARFTIASKRLTSDRKRGLATCQAEALNQRGETVQAGQNTLIFNI
ncbi:MAG: MaoC family dehydratase [Pseudomonadota bacterium]